MPKNTPAFEKAIRNSDREQRIRRKRIARAEKEIVADVVPWKIPRTWPDGGRISKDTADTHIYCGPHKAKLVLRVERENCNRYGATATVKIPLFGMRTGYGTHSAESVYYASISGAKDRDSAIRAVTKAGVEAGFLVER